jgi:hypothetical protein
MKKTTQVFTPKPPDARIVSYLTFRKLIGILGMSLAPILIIGTFLTDHSTVILPSVSAYYYTGMRDELIGIICGIAFFLSCYHGLWWVDSLLSKVAAVAAFGIAFFPTSATDDKSDILSKLHYISAAIFFAVLACMSLFLFTKSDPSGHMTRQKRIRNRIYRVCGIVIVVAAIAIPICQRDGIREHIRFLKPTLILEIIALEAFGFSWLVKGEFILKDKVRHKK